jgi:hypothetical protein
VGLSELETTGLRCETDLKRELASDMMKKCAGVVDGGEIVGVVVVQWWWSEKGKKKVKKIKFFLRGISQ